MSDSCAGMYSDAASCLCGGTHSCAVTCSYAAAACAGRESAYAAEGSDVGVRRPACGAAAATGDALCAAMSDGGPSADVAAACADAGAAV